MSLCSYFVATSTLATEGSATTANGIGKSKSIWVRWYDAQSASKSPAVIFVVGWRKENWRICVVVVRITEEHERWSDILDRRLVLLKTLMHITELLRTPHRFRTDEWTKEWMNEWMNVWMNEQMNYKLLFIPKWQLTWYHERGSSSHGLRVSFIIYRQLVV